MSGRISEDQFHARVAELVEDFDTSSIQEIADMLGMGRLAVSRWLRKEACPVVSERGRILEILEEEMREKISADYENVVRLMKRYMPDSFLLRELR